MQKRPKFFPLHLPPALVLLAEIVHVGGKRIPFKSSVWNLGVHLDQTLSMQQHTSSSFNLTILDSECICPTRFICHNIPAWLLQFHPFRISSKADFTLSLQRVQNNAAKLVLTKSRYDHVTPPCKNCFGFWLKFRPQYKIATFVYRCFDGSLPGYLSQTLCAYEPTRNLRLSCEKLLKVPKRNTKMFGEHSFSFLAPSVWNRLPSDLRNSSTLPLFKSILKTHLFMTAFCQ